MHYTLLVLTVYFCGANAFRNAFDTELYESVIDDVECSRQLDHLSNSSLGLRFLDASAKFPPGVMSGNINDLGDYYQCLAIDQKEANMDFHGKYCTVIMPLNQIPIQIPEWPDFPDLNITLPENITWPEIPEWPTPDSEVMENLEKLMQLQRFSRTLAGVARDSVMVTNGNEEGRIFPMLIATLGATLAFCIPKVCRTRQAVDFIQERLVFLNFTYNEYYCRLPDDKPLVPADYTAFAIFGVIRFLLIFSTAYDLFCVFYLKTDSNHLYRCFSVYTNTRRFLTFNSPPGALECVDGIRAISMAWVVAGHTYSMTLLGFLHNGPEILVWMRQFSSTWVNSAPITVDTFFLLSGILAVYTTIGKISRGRFIRSIHLFYINRLLRMFPLLAAVILLQASILNHVSDGPFWQNTALAAENCRKYWWSTLLHVQNYVNTLDFCLAQTWYLSVDMQLYYVCPLILVWMFDSRRMAWVAVTCVLLLSLVSSSVISFKNSFSAALIHPGRMGEFSDYISVYYINTLTRASPFFVGMIYGYLLHTWRDRNIRIAKINVYLLWVLSFVIMSFCIFTIYPVMQLEHDSQVFDSFLNSYMRAIWACALGWLIFACVKGYGGPINWLLSLKMWKLPARLSYAMYLIHLPLIMVANSSWVKTHYFSNGETMYRFMSDFLFTFLAAFVLCIAIDAPFSTLQKFLLGGNAVNYLLLAGAPLGQEFRKKTARPVKTESRQVICDNEADFKTSL